MSQPTRLRTGVPLVLALVLAACAPRENPELQWARAALQRNPNVEIVAVDSQAGVFTLRNSHTGAVQAVGLNELAAAPMERLERANDSPAAPTPGELAHENAVTPATQSGGDAAVSPATQAREATAPARDAPAVPSESATPPMSAVPEPALPMQPAASAAAVAPAKPYTIERNGDQLRVSGPGISVVSAGARSAAGQDSRTQHAVDPIICEGPRLLHVDNRDIYVDGDAIVARGGCELYITNSTVIGARTGLVVQDAMVHIANSRIEGDTASFEAGSTARLFVRGSTFRGVPRREEGAAVQDQGGNRWR